MRSLLTRIVCCIDFLWLIATPFLIPVANYPIAVMGPIAPETIITTVPLMSVHGWIGGCLIATMLVLIYQNYRRKSDASN